MELRRIPYSYAVIAIYWTYLLVTLFHTTTGVKATESECPNDSQPISPNPQDCTTYFQCDHGKLITRPCAAGLHFNPTISACDWPQNANCNVDNSSASTTVASTTVELESSTIIPIIEESTSTEHQVSTQEPEDTTVAPVETEATSTTQGEIETTSTSFNFSSPAPTKSTTTRPSGTKDSVKFAPYFDVTMSGPKMTDIYAKSGQKDYVLAFAIGNTQGCVPSWGGQYAIDDPQIITPIRELQSKGGRLIVATGGAMGPYFEQLCADVDSLTSAYKKVLDAVKTNHLDIDIESNVQSDVVNQALARVQKERPSTTVSYTLMVQAEDYGLTPQLGVDILKNAKKNGVRVDYVNPMTMEFGGPSPDFGDSVINAAKSVVKQMKEIWPEKSTPELYKMLAVTPMIGRNFNGKQFKQEHAKKLVSWANQAGVGRLHFWSAGRDHGTCAGGGVSPTCSSITQSDFEFIKIFQGFK